jgi:hypothetical protein
VARSNVLTAPLQSVARSNVLTAPLPGIAFSNLLAITTLLGPTFFDGFDLLAALQAWWQGQPGMQALTSDGRLWHVEAPEDIRLPYATFFLVSDVAEIWTTAYDWQRCSVQLNFHAPRVADARSMAKAFRVAVKGAPLTIDGSPVAHVLPDGETLEIGEGLGNDGQDCWIAAQVLDVPFTQ